MSYLRDYWYCAAWSNEISRTPLARTLLGEKVVMYRREQGGIIALGNVCPHRFAPLHQGKLHGDALACPYHGLQFGEDGTCVHNPHGEVHTGRLSVKSYPVVERYSTAWIWMGAPELADESKIPEFSEHSDPKFRCVHGYIHIKGNYELISDNLLDLSHTQYLHSFLQHNEDPESRIEFRIEMDGSTLTTIDNRLNIQKASFVKFVWPEGPDRIDSYSGVRWQPPANMRLKTHMAGVDRDPAKDGCVAWGAELATPETETTSHYFWSYARNYRLDDKALDVALQQAIDGVFTNEDAKMIAELQSEMGDVTDLLSLRPVTLPTDSAAIKARLIVRTLLKKEAEATE